MSNVRTVKPTSGRIGNLARRRKQKPRVIDLSLPAQGWQLYLNAKNDSERLAVDLSDDDAMKLVLLELAAGKHPRPTTETLHSWDRDENGRVVAIIHGSANGEMVITCK